MNDEFLDYWSTATMDEWQRHVEQVVGTCRELAEDWDQTFYEALRALSDVYQRLHSERGSEKFDHTDERSTEDYFWGLQRASTVIDSIVGSACVILMRWMDCVKRMAISAFALLETPFPPAPLPEQETKNAKWERHGHLMRNYGTRVAGKQISGAEAVWQIGNCFKHSNGGDTLRPATKKTVTELGFASQLLEIPQSAAEQELRDVALKTVSYTLGTDSIERMAIQLGCSPDAGLMPLYKHVDAWRLAIDEKLAQGIAALKKAM
jgi:hypothetical protein